MASVKKRFVASTGWGHIFVGKNEKTTRWVYDRTTEKLVAAQVLSRTRWVEIDRISMGDLQESIQDNDAPDRVDNFGLLELHSFSGWDDLNKVPA